MYRAIAAALAMGGLAARAAVGYGPLGCSAAPPCGCEPVIVCDPCCEVFSPTPPRAPDQLPAPRKDQAKKQPEEAKTPTPAPPANEFPTAPNANASAVEPPTPATEPSAPPTQEEPAEYQSAPPETPAEQPPVTAGQPTPAQPAPPADASRYGNPPAEQPTTPAADPYEGLFPPADGAGEAGTLSAETPATETPATEPPASDPPPVPDADEASPRTPDYDELFPPSSSTGVQSAPGGWASEAPRSWHDGDGRVLATGRIAGVTAQQVVLSGEDGARQALPYASLSENDLRFLRDQVAARRAEVQATREADRLLAGQQ
jgi:hypothetical protein